MDLCISAIVKVIHRALVDKNYESQSNVQPSDIANLSLRMQKIVRCVMNQAVQMSNSIADWEVQVLEPVVAQFTYIDQLGVSADDAEYVMLLTAAFITVFEALQLPSKDRNELREHLHGMINSYFTEEEIRHAVLDEVILEQRRLVRADAGTRVLRAVDGLLGLLLDVPLNDNESNPRHSNLLNRVSMTPSEKIEKWISDTTLAPTVPKKAPYETTLPQDISIKVYLKPNSTWTIDYVDSVAATDEGTLVTTYLGLVLQVENGFIASPKASLFDTVTIRATGESVGKLAATLKIPPGYCFRVAGVESVTEEGEVGEMKIETQRALLIVGGGEYLVRRKDCRSSVMVESVEC